VTSEPSVRPWDRRNVIADAYGRLSGEGGQRQNSAYLPALVLDATETGDAQLLPHRIRLL
jgi:hypothetical protein